MRFFCIYRMTSIDWEVQLLLLTTTIMDPVSPFLSLTLSLSSACPCITPTPINHLTYLLPYLPQRRLSRKHESRITFRLSLSSSTKQRRLQVATGTLFGGIFGGIGFGWRDLT